MATASQMEFEHTLFPFGKPIWPEGVFFYDSYQVAGSEVRPCSSSGLKPSDCDPRVTGNANDEGCREVIAQFLSLENNVHTPGKNVDISQSNIPDDRGP